LYTISVAHELKHETFNGHWAEQFVLERSSSDMSFSDLHVANGNLSELTTNTSMVKETVHEQYRKKNVIPITMEIQK